MQIISLSIIQRKYIVIYISYVDTGEKDIIPPGWGMKVMEYILEELAFETNLKNWEEFVRAKN